jgi:hypothetical protein
MTVKVKDKRQAKSFKNRLTRVDGVATLKLAGPYLARTSGINSGGSA